MRFSMGRALRANFSLKIRQPLKAIYLVTRDAEEKNNSQGNGRNNFRRTQC